MERLNAKIEIVATALEPVHHGAGVSGNTQMLRTQEIVQPDGTHARVPFISGNSLKHMIREHGARFALDTMKVPDGSLTKPVTDLLFSGGALTKIGANMNLAKGRELEDLFPLLSLCGYSAGNTMTQSKIRVNNLHLVCAENRWRAPDSVQDKKTLELHAGHLRDLEFGTRHESSRRPFVSKMLTGGEKTRLEGLAQAVEKGDSAQMIYDYEVIKPGAVFWGAMYLDDITEMEKAALQAALSLACEGRGSDGGYLFRVGAKNSIGCGLVSMLFNGSLRSPVQEPTFVDAALVSVDPKDNVTAYVNHLQTNTEAILTALRESME